MPFPLLARKVRQLVSQPILHLRQLLTTRGFSKFKRLYRIKGELGQGGFGIVYKGVRLADGLPVAMKFVERRHVREWGKVDDQRVPMEVCMLARCTRLPGVIGLLDWFALPEGFLIVMERPSPCVDLFDFIHCQKSLAEPLARFLFRQIVRTVADCQDRKVLHRDLKDENVVIELLTGRTKLVDFGAATLMNRNRYQDFQGTRLYCPPEWFLHSLYLGREAAVWSLGVLLYNMLNGRLPFLNEKDICTAQLLGPLPFFASLSRDARDLLTQCLNFDPFGRPSLDQILAHQWLAPDQSPTSADWRLLTATLRASHQEPDDMDEAVEVAEKGAQQRESGLASGDSGGQSLGRSSSPQMRPNDRVPTAKSLGARASREMVVARRREAKTAHSVWQPNTRVAGKEKPLDAAAEPTAHSIVPPEWECGQIQMCSNEKVDRARGSLDSGNASALHSPGSALLNDEGNPFREFDT